MDKVLFVKNPLYERFNKVMAKNNKNKHSAHQNTNNIQNNSAAEKKSLWDSVKSIEKIPTLISIGMSVFAAGIGLYIGVNVLQNDMNYLNKDVDAFKTDIQKQTDSMEEDIDTLTQNISALTTDIAVLSTSVNNISEDLKAVTERLNNYEQNFSNSVLNISLSPQAPQMRIETIDEQNAIFLSMPSVKTSVKTMALDCNTGREYSSDDLINQNIFFTYTEGKQQILFLGKYDKNGAWDDRCLLNVYEDGKLVTIMDAIYENGTLVNYTQIMSDVYNGTAIWLKSVRTIADNGIKTGETWKYNRDEDISMSFEFEQAINTDIIPIFKFEEEQDLVLNGYYNGNTSNGKYNDATGNAYSVRFFEDGTVATLYQGNFVNGLYDDTTGNAWYITRSFDTDYMYYKGHFAQGNTLNNEGYIFENPISRTRINEIINGKIFDCDLKWYEQL